MKSILATFMRSRLSVGISVFAITALTVGGAVYATVPSKGVINGCYNKWGDLRIVKNARDCNRKETALSWNQTGPQGPQGPAATTQLSCVACTPRDVLARLNKPNFIKANLDYANLFGSELKNQDFSSSSFVHAVLYGAQIQGSNFTNANFSNASLRNAAFINTMLTNSNLTGADLTFTGFSGSDLSTTNRTDVIWSHTTCPDGTNSDEHDNTCEGHLVP